MFELPAGFKRKKRWLACFSLSVQRQDASVCSLSAGCFTTEEVKDGTRKLFFKVAGLSV